MKTVAFDFETHPIAPGSLAPAPVCLSLASRHDLRPYLPRQEGLLLRDSGGLQEVLIGDDVPGTMVEVMSRLLADPVVHLIGANTAFDTAVAVYADPARLLPAVFAAADAERLHDVMLIEMLLNLSTSGNLETMTLPTGEVVECRYALSDLEARRLGVDRSADKDSDSGDHWRINYHALSGWRASDYPPDAASYAMADAVGTLLVHESQLAARKDAFHGSCNTEAMQCAVSVCLYLMSAHGLGVDQAQVERMEQALLQKLSPEAHAPLYEAGLLTPPKPPRQYKNGSVDADGRPKMVAGQPEKRCDKKIREYVQALCDERGLSPKLTETGQVSMDADTLKQLAAIDDTGLMALLHTRAHYDKIRTTYLPTLKGNERIYPGYNTIVSTGRTSSRGNGRGRKQLYPSCNIQNIPRIEEGDLNVRACFVPGPGKVFCSIDFSALELCSFAQMTYSLFGFSVHRDKINKGFDLHAYLGSRLAANLDGGFREAVYGIDDPDEVYRRFVALKADEAGAKVFKHYRTFAKPTGLGFPGGLGAQTFIEYARATYGVQVDLETAQTLKNLWLQTYPEADRYLNEWVPRQEDGQHGGSENGGYCYTSPLGMFRANASYCACANGFGLQTPSAEGAKLAVYDSLRRCVDPVLDDPLFGGMLVAFVHDELIFEFDEETAFAQGDRAARLMVDAMSILMPDVKLGAAPTYMRRWLKGAEPASVGGVPVIYDMAGGKIFMTVDGRAVTKKDLDS